jgi:hypothetical protein
MKEHLLTLTFLVQTLLGPRWAVGSDNGKTAEL